MVVGSHDVEIAFDEVGHEEEAVAVLESGVPIKVVAALVRENMWVGIVYNLPSVGFTEPAPLGKGFPKAVLMPPEIPHFP